MLYNKLVPQLAPRRSLAVPSIISYFPLCRYVNTLISNICVNPLSYSWVNVLIFIYLRACRLSIAAIFFFKCFLGIVHSSVRSLNHFHQA